MNIQYENQQQSSLLGLYRQRKQKENETGQPSEQIIHKVVYGDTLQGLSLTYDIPLFKIRQRNNIESDQIYHLKEIVIPNPQVEPKFQTSEEQYIKIQEFLCYMMQSQKSTKTARYYLSENAWNVQKAVKQYRQDLEWEQSHKIISKPIKNKLSDYTEMELMTKKKS